MPRRIKEPRFVKLDITPSWYWHRDARSQLLPLAMLLFLQSKLRPLHREFRMHLEGIEVEAVNAADEDMTALAGDLQRKLSALSSDAAHIRSTAA